MSLKLHHFETSHCHGELDGMPFHAEARDGKLHAQVRDVPGYGVWEHVHSDPAPVTESALRGFIYAAVARYREWQRGIAPVTA